MAFEMRSRFGVRGHLVNVGNVCPWCLQSFFPMFQILLQSWLPQGAPQGQVCAPLYWRSSSEHKELEKMKKFGKEERILTLFEDYMNMYIQNTEVI